MDENEKMVKLLLSRGKMLSHHCPKCSLPLFEKDKKVLCVRCGEVRVEKEGTKKVKGAASKGLKQVLKKKRDGLLKRLDSEEDPNKIASIVEAISKIEEALKGS
jgi:uncharacterized Zn finger protein (UPF0148 family)